jgi:hypothetical protein
MTKFEKSKFSYYGGYLNYTGTYQGQPTYAEYYGAEKCHPTRLNMPKEAFIARFKYKGPFTKATFIRELIKNHTVEEYVGALNSGKAPLQVLREKNPTWYNKIMETL